MAVYEFGPFQLRAGPLMLLHRGRPVQLGPKVVETLLAFVERPGEVIAKDALLDRIWPHGFVEESNLPQNIHVLRKTFARYGCADPIETLPRRGYRFRLTVRPVEANAPLRGFSSRAASALASAIFAAGTLAFIGGYGSTQHHGARPPELSVAGARWYQTGRYYWNLRTRDGVRRSLSYFSKVVDADPTNARGYAALADANVSMGAYCYGTHQPAVYFARAAAYAKRALTLDPNSAEAHAATGMLALHHNDRSVAMTELRRAIAIDSAYGPAHEWYGIAFVADGRIAEGVGQLKTAAQLDPLSVATTAWLATAALRAGRFADAIAYSRQALELAPGRPDVLATIGRAYENQGNFNRAIAAFRRLEAVDAYYRPQAAALMAHALALAHRSSQARALFAFARAHANQVNGRDLSAAASALGDSRPEPPAVHHSGIFS